MICYEKYIRDGFKEGLFLGKHQDEVFIDWLKENKFSFLFPNIVSATEIKKINQILNETIPKERIPDTKTNLGICSPIQHSQERTSKDVNEDS